MCVYHAVPLLDWDLTGQAPQLTVLPSVPVGGASSSSVVAFRSGVSPNGYAVVESSTNTVTVNNQASAPRNPLFARTSKLLKPVKRYIFGDYANLDFYILPDLSL